MVFSPRDVLIALVAAFVGLVPVSWLALTLKDAYGVGVLAVIAAAITAAMIPLYVRMRKVCG